MKKGLSGLAALYLALYASTQDEKSSPPSHYQLLMKFKETGTHCCACSLSLFVMKFAGEGGGGGRGGEINTY